MQLVTHNRVQLIWVPGHEDIVGNQTADLLVRMISEHPFIGLEAASGMPVAVAKKAARDWTNRNNKKHWESVT
jgi:ribonuclease HI